MASVPGSHYNVFAGNQIVNFGVTTDPNNVPAAVAGNFNLEVISNASGTGSFSTASGYQGLAVLSANGSVLATGHGNYGVQDTGGNDSIVAGDGNVSILGASGDTLTGGTGNYFIDAHVSNESVVGGSAGGRTIWGGAGDRSGRRRQCDDRRRSATITGGTGNYFIDAHLSNQFVVGGSAGDGTIWGGAGDTIRAAPAM
jgi:hypothetical protein